MNLLKSINENYDKKWSLMSFFPMTKPRQWQDNNKVNKLQLWLYLHAISLTIKDEPRLKKYKNYAKISFLFSSEK